MADHDQRFKSLLKAFFAEFFQVFFPAWADRFDFAHVDWLEQEVFTDPPQGTCRPRPGRPSAIAPAYPPPATAPDEPADRLLTLIHVEIESQDTVAPLRPRMLSYYEQLRRRHGLPSCPSRVSARWAWTGSAGMSTRSRTGTIGWSPSRMPTWGCRPSTASEYVAGEHLLGVALDGPDASAAGTARRRSMPRRCVGWPRRERMTIGGTCSWTVWRHMRRSTRCKPSNWGLLPHRAVSGGPGHGDDDIREGRATRSQQGLQQGLQQGWRTSLRCSSRPGSAR